MNTNTLKIAVIESNIEALEAMIGIIVKHFPVYVCGLLVGPEHEDLFMVIRIRELRPDIILVANPITKTLETHLFLSLLPDQFYRLGEGEAGNPRVISTSRNTGSEIVGLIGGLFERKDDLLSESAEVRADAARNLVGVVGYALERLTS